MTEVALLNPRLEASVCREMIELLSKRLARHEHALCNTPLEREPYLRAYSAAEALREARNEMQVLYNMRFNR